MTKRGKCKTCRLRKVKCDEARPTCGPCAKTHRPCIFGDPNTQARKEHDALAIRSIRSADDQKGAFLVLDASITTFGKPSTPLSNSTTQLIARWARMLTTIPAGSTTNGMPPLFGGNQALDKTAVYLCDSHNAYMTRNEADVITAVRSGAVALSTVRKGLLQEGAMCSNHILLAIGFLLLANYLSITIAQSPAYHLHAVAIGKLLKQRWLQGQWGELEEMMARNMSIEETGVSVLAGKLSDMDDPARLEVRARILTGDRPVNLRAGSLVTDKLFQLPRLVLMTRQLIAGTGGAQHVADTLVLARSLYEIPMQEEIDRYIEESTIRSTSVSHPLGERIDYADDEALGVIIFYYLWRNVICGIIDRLSRYVDPFIFSLYLDAGAVQQEDIEVATNVSLSVEYAQQKVLGPPLNALRIVTPLLLSIGTWTRLEARIVDATDDDASYSKTMWAYAVDAHVRSMKMWSLPSQPGEVLAEACDMYTGGKICNSTSAEND